ncbi:N-acetylmuramidase family protein [Paraburkholderia tropica]|uniref:N-acetylmuramidase family protein n=1 Tax=Paraburkholderia tropica TaxID=92647 RepID=UPI002AB6FF30|nr:N-acetylmuramidase family protein [Paraburkholderia tropica]
MAHPHRKARPAAPKAPKVPPSPYVQVTILLRDRLDKPIEGLDVQIKAGAGAPPAPAWKLGLDEDQAPTGAAPASTPTSASEPVAAPIVRIINEIKSFTDSDGYATAIQNAERNQPIDVLVKNRHGVYVPKASIVPKKDYSTFRILSSEYHVEATTKLTPKESFEQDIKIPAVKDGEVMTMNRLVGEFGPYIGWAQKVTEQGKIKKDFPTKNKETVTDEKTGKQKTKITIEHHYKIVDTGKPCVILFNILGSKLNYPKTLEITEGKYSEAAKKLECEAAAIKAVAMTESSGKGFCDNGLAKILYERHNFLRAMLPEEQRNFSVAELKTVTNPFPMHPNLCFPTPGGYSEKGGAELGWSHSDDFVMHQYERLILACSLNREAAIQACSWGAFQVLGFFYKELGYSTAEELANSAMRGIDEQFELFAAYVNMNTEAKKALQKKDWRLFAFYYNGKNYPKKYPEDMKKFYDKYK